MEVLLMRYSLRSIRMVSTLVGLFLISPVSASEQSSTNYFVSGLKTVAQNSKIIGWNVLSGIGTGIVHVTNALVPTSYLFKQSMENPKTAVCAAAITTYVGYTLKSSAQLAEKFKEAHNYINPNELERTCNPRLSLALQDCYENIREKAQGFLKSTLTVTSSSLSSNNNLVEATNALQQKPKLLVSIWNTNNAHEEQQKKDPIDRLKVEIEKERVQLDNHSKVLVDYLHRASLLPGILYEAPIIVQQAQNNLIAAGKLVSFETYGELSQEQMDLIEQEVKRLNSMLVRPDKHYESYHDDTQDDDSFEESNSIMKTAQKGARYLGSLLAKTPHAFITGLRVLPHAANKWLVNMIYSKEQQAQWDYWLLCKQKAALERLQNELSRSS